MASIHTPPSPVVASFNTAREEFLRDFPDDEYAKPLSQFTSIDDVYDATDNIQKEQGKSRTLQNLAKIQPYLECLNQYATIMDTIVQVKPEILALIWAPIKLLLIVSSTYMKSFAKILDSIDQVGAALPHFKFYADLFARNEPIQRILGLFFRDILDFHSIALKFFKLKHWRVLFESLWPKYSSRFEVILKNIAQHRIMMDSEVTLVHITEAYAARVATYEKFERDQEHDERMEFQNIMTSLSPKFYDTELETIKKRCSIPAGKWLEKDRRFLEWQDASNQSARVLWLTGIPGAGKTFLSSIIINRLQSKLDPPPVAFAFLSHQSDHGNHALTILHSFLFQLMTDNKELRPVLSYTYENNYRKLTSSSEFLENLLNDLLRESRTTYLVVDGVDEVADVERSLLLKSLMRLENLKLLISSRAEYDITLFLASQCERIKVHESNAQDISEYVEYRTNNWLSGLEADPEIISELRHHTKTIALKSKGMFLYARLVCDGLGHLSDLDDMKEEVTNLPNGLSEAYGRILHRIDQSLTPLERAQTKSILEWVSCSIVPITRYEVQAALFVARGKDPSRGRKELPLDVVRRCGPIIEIINDHVRFVHFSAKEYLFSSESHDYLRMSEVHYSISETCLRYLLSDCFDSGLSDEAISEGILLGAYVLLDYAASHWLEHILRGSRNLKTSSCIKDVSCAIEKMIKLRKNWTCDGSYTSRAPVHGLGIFEKQVPEVFETLIHIYSFLQRRWRELSLDDGELWVNEDPLTISATQLRVHALLEAALCQSSSHQQDCKCIKIQRQYGLRLFKCNRLGCPFFRSGFDMMSERNRHLRTHDRPYKCDRPNCDFSDMGFGSQARLNVHLRHHEKQGTSPMAHPAEFDYHDDVELILFDAVKADDLDLVRDFIADVPRFHDKLLKEAVTSSSCEMLEVLLNACNSEDNIESTALAYAVRADNLEASRMLLNRGASVLSKHDAYEYMISAMRNRSPEMVKLLLPYKPVQGDWTSPSFLSFWIPDTQAGLSQEARAIQCLSLLRDWTHEKNAFEFYFLINAQRVCSIAIAEHLLRNGVDVNTRGIDGRTALWLASLENNKRVAEFIKFLLESGADADFRPKGWKPIKDRRGPRNISKWLGVSWEQLIEESRKKYAASLERKPL